jgi:GAF domain-containing protein
MLVDSVFAPWRDEAIKRGYASSIVLPLMEEKKAFGAINIYSKETDPFSEGEIRLLEELADDLAYGIMAIRLRSARAEAEEQILRNSDELRRSVEELERFNRAMVDRELRLIELKKQVNELCARVGEPPRYPHADDDDAAKAL